VIQKTTFILFLITSCIVFSQEKRETNSFVESDDVNILNTPRFYRNYFSEYHLNENWFFRMEMLERSNNNLIESYTLIEHPLLAKYKISNKLSVLFGTKVDVLKTDGKVDDVSLYSTFGIQYDVSKSTLLEARFNYRLSNGTSIIPDYTFGSKTSFMVGSKIKF
tara:strand:+ start:3946 stop:4437 length:492 start_codon:yes stop_codon:yes gene_type:complete